ncbi:hypothetical protein Ddye_029359 [Dipteronia dyeriana]|uniref:Uncharacterized protein n=1 Tax=Dipteronia dyeriana TaxID=168575 RepID=A0AAD9TEF3_9ROSI|nr:hypothetical protein Ddye_029359 [Dipteronia dyeriana]
MTTSTQRRRADERNQKRGRDATDEWRREPTTSTDQRCRRRVDDDVETDTTTTIRSHQRSRNSKKGYCKVRYRLYDFPWAVEADVKEVLEATDDEAQVDYWVGVDYNMTEGLQFISLVEMEMKEKHELLDEGDDDNDGVVGDGDGDDRAATSQRALKRKAQKKKKKTSVKNKQRKAVPVTKLDQDEDYTPGYTPNPHVDYTPGYTPTPHVDNTLGYTPTPLHRIPICHPDKSLDLR